MSLTEDIVLQLVSLGLGHPVEWDTPLSGIDWKAVIDLAMSHGLDVVAWDGLQALYELRPELAGELDASLGETKYDWFSFTLQAEQDYEAYRRTLRDLVAFYNAEGIPVLLLKGYGLSLNYPVPVHRPTGDIDIYLFGEWERADRALASKTGVRIDNSHHHHSVFNFGGRSMENHYDLLNIYAHRSSRRLEPLLKELANKG